MTAKKDNNTTGWAVWVTEKCGGGGIILDSKENRRFSDRWDGTSRMTG